MAEFIPLQENCSCDLDCNNHFQANVFDQVKWNEKLAVISKTVITSYDVAVIACCRLQGLANQQSEASKASHCNVLNCFRHRDPDQSFLATSELLTTPCKYRIWLYMDLKRAYDTYPQ
jgi:hypothetical protein